VTIHTPHPYLKKLDRVLDRMGGLYNARDILNAVEASKMQMFAEGDSIAITQIGIYPRAKVLEILGVIGNLEDLRTLHDRLLIFAAETGCSAIQAYGRKGFFADAERRGWRIKARAYVYRKDMT
jgi:hypothetical protein